jgi:hypothetical protein
LPYEIDEDAADFYLKFAHVIAVEETLKIKEE